MVPAVGLTFWGEAHYQIEVSGEFASAGRLEGGEVDGDRFPLGVVFDAFPNSVFGVGRIAFDVALGRPPFSSLHLDSKMDMRSATWISDRLNRSE